VNQGLPRALRTSKGQLLGSLLERHLPTAKEFRRAVGFFSVGAFDYGFSAYARFFRGGGRASFVFSPFVDPPTLEALVAGTTRYWKAELIQFPSGASQEGGSPGRRLLVWALSTGALRCKVALMTSRYPRGLYHEKIGLFVQSGGVEVGFEGSANETAAAYRHNFERVRIFDSSCAGPQAEATAALARDFAATWKNEVVGLRVISLETALREDVFHVGESAGADHPGAMPINGAVVTSHKVEPEYIRPPLDLTLRDYQEKAVVAWLTAGGIGVLSMATGAGKTLTALSAVARVRAAVTGGLVVIFVAPFLHLVDQWIESAKAFGLSPIRCAEGAKRWSSPARSAIHLVNAGRRDTLSLAVSNATFASSAF